MMNKKAFILHPATWITVSFFFGFLVAWLIARQFLDIGISICPVD